MPNKFWDHGPMLVSGCTPESDGCNKCWSARAHAMRCHNAAVSHVYRPDQLTDGMFNGKVQFNLFLLERAIDRAKPGEVICPWNELYHEDITDEQRDQAFARMALRDDLYYLIITKRVKNALRYWTDPNRAVGVSLQAISLGYKGRLHDEFTKLVYNNMWTIATTENQAMADKRIPDLIQIPGHRGVIIEPMLESLDIRPYLPHQFNKEPHCLWCEACIPSGDGSDYWKQRTVGNHDTFIDQVILGPENGPSKRPFKPEWADAIKAQCKAAGVSFYRKDEDKGQLAWRSESDD